MDAAKRVYSAKLKDSYTLSAATPTEWKCEDISIAQPFASQKSLLSHDIPSHQSSPVDPARLAADRRSTGLAGSG